MPASVTIRVFSTNWEQKSLNAINQRKRVRLVVKGLEAQTAAAGLSRNRATAGITGTEAVVITAAIIVGIIAVVGLGVLAAVCLYGINQGYTIKARHVVKGPLPFDDELYFDLHPPA